MIDIEHFKSVNRIRHGGSGHNHTRLAKLLRQRLRKVEPAGATRKELSPLAARLRRGECETVLDDIRVLSMRFTYGSDGSLSMSFGCVGSCERRKVQQARWRRRAGLLYQPRAGRKCIISYGCKHLLALSQRIFSFTFNLIVLTRPFCSSYRSHENACPAISR